MSEWPQSIFDVAKDVAQDVKVVIPSHWLPPLRDAPYSLEEYLAALRTFVGWCCSNGLGQWTSQQFSSLVLSLTAMKRIADELDKNDVE